MEMYRYGCQPYPIDQFYRSNKSNRDGTATITAAFSVGGTPQEITFTVNVTGGDTTVNGMLDIGKK